MKVLACPKCGEPLADAEKYPGSVVYCTCGMTYELPKDISNVFDPEEPEGNMLPVEEPSSDSSMTDDQLLKWLRQQINPRRKQLKKWLPLQEWLTYLAILSIVILITIRGNLWKAVVSDSTGLTLFIVIIFFIALGKSAFDVFYIHREFLLAQRQIDELWRVSKFKEFFLQAEQSIFRDHIRNLYVIYREDGNVSQDNLIEILHARLSSRTKVVDLSAGILTTLGLIGTIIGLVMSVNGIQQMTGEIGTGGGALLEKMSLTLSGMGVAFYTTLMGAILGGIFLRVLTASVQGSQDYLVAHIAELSEVHILPRLRSYARSRNERGGN